MATRLREQMESNDAIKKRVYALIAQMSAKEKAVVEGRLGGKSNAEIELELGLEEGRSNRIFAERIRALDRDPMLRLLRRK